MSRTAAILLLIALAIALFATAQTLRLREARAVATAAELRAESALLVAADWEAATLTASTALATCQAQWADVQQRGADALAQAQRHRDIALDALDTWRARWAEITTDCSAALAATDAACVELEGY